jgi:hypothetical protein
MMRFANVQQRQGTVIVCVLACLAIAAALSALMIQSALQGRREARLQCQLRQTELLCEAGVLRAVQQLKNSEGYEGEEWEPELNLPAYFDAHVHISVSQSNDTAPHEIAVVARLDSSNDNDGPMQRSHNFTYNASTP